MSSHPLGTATYIYTESLDAKRSKQQRVGDIVPEGAQFLERMHVPCGVSDLLRGATTVPRGNGGADYTSKVGQKGAAAARNGV